MTHDNRQLYQHGGFFCARHSVAIGADAAPPEGYKSRMLSRHGL